MSESWSEPEEGLDDEQLTVGEFIFPVSDERRDELPGDLVWVEAPPGKHPEVPPDTTYEDDSDGPVAGEHDWSRWGTGQEL